MDSAVLWGDGHTHSDWSEGFATLAQNTCVFERFEADFHVATDHLLVDVSRPGYVWTPSAFHRRNFRLTWDTLPAYLAECRQSSTANHLTVPGLELTWVNAAHGNFGATDRAHVLVREHLERLPAPVSACPSPAARIATRWTSGPAPACATP